ncbi:helix-turn-helix domain-containing protein [Paenibacillus hunanensis]|uniref:helix-turn-helix domain-containing protein n=1 Tax=Paenibacillus hunanensis TaxID=539262 RepID=UPI003898E934
MTIREVASRIQILTNSLSLIENEKSKPSLSTIKKLSTLFNREIWYLGALSVCQKIHWVSVFVRRGIIVDGSSRI